MNFKSPQKKINFAVTLCLFLLISGLSIAAVHYPFDKKRAEQKLEEQSKNLPLYEGSPDRPFEVVRDIRVDGMTKNKKKVYTKLKARALSLKGDAVVEIYCDTIKSFSVSCFGTVVRWK